MVIISHHWLDGLSCDLATNESPHGLRLTTMSQRFEQFFPSSCPGMFAMCSSPVSELSKALTSAIYTDYDVLIFFDFMCLPQKGKSSDGTVIERTAEDQAVFQEVLPACGLLYTMFPVMVCPEVSAGVSSYSSSGWCFCEWEQSKLCQTLSPYSLDTVAALTDTEGVLSLESIEWELQEKQFRCEPDREIVRDIVRGTWIRRQLLAAVVAQHVEKVFALLKELSDQNLIYTISFPVDSSSLDSLLHVATKLPSKEITASLIDYGADQTRPNHRGEQPGDFFVFPRSWFPSGLTQIFD